MREEQYYIYMIGRRAVCPNCSGMAVLQAQAENIRCIDCGNAFKIKGVGQTEREIICTQEG